MIDLLGIVEPGDGRATLRGSGLAVDEILARLEAGEPPAKVASGTGLGPAEIVAALAFGSLGVGEGPSLVRGRPARPGLAGALADDALRALLPKAAEPARLALAAGLLQIYDFWDASHDAAQRADDLGDSHTAAFWHGIAHRREPDFGNASYWFRRVGNHPTFPAIGAAASERLGAHDGPVPDKAANLVRRGRWNSESFLDFSRHALPGSPAEVVARLLQVCEMAGVLGASLEAAI